MPKERLMLKEHDFKKSLAWSAQQVPICVDFWRMWFPGMTRTEITCETEAGAARQVAGVDAWLTSPQIQFMVEEKVRRPNPRTGLAWDDISLELVSNDVFGTEGWAVKGSKARLLLYVRKCRKRALAFAEIYPMQAVQTLVPEKQAEWVREYHRLPAGNVGGYRSWSVPVPFKVFNDEIDRVHGPFNCLGCNTVCRWSDYRGLRACRTCRPDLGNSQRLSRLLRADELD